MPFTVFYAWQMDLDTKLNRWFIQGAIKEAIRLLQAENSTASDSPKLDIALGIDKSERQVTDPDADNTIDTGIIIQSGAQGNSGAEIIAEVILERIESCDAFIADITPVANVRTFDNRTKKTPNANVLIELGAASQKRKGWKRVTLVLNAGFGRPEELPFDLKHRHCTVVYELLSATDSEKAKKRKQLAQSIANQIRPLYGEYLIMRQQIDDGIPVNQYFKGQVLRKLSDTMALSEQQNRPAFVIVYDRAAHGNSDMSHGLRYMMEFEETKNLVQETFVQAIVEASDPDVRPLLPPDVNLEHCYLIARSPTGNLLERRSVYANPSEGLKIVKNVIRTWQNSKA